MKRKSLLKIFGATLALCVVSGALVSVNTALTAKAAAPTGALFKMEEKASVRLGDNADDSGIRFRVVMDETMKNYIVDNEEVTYGFLIFQQKDLATVSGNYHDIAMKVAIDGDEKKIYLNGEDGNYYANGVLASIKEANFDRELTCVAYTYDGANYEYADLNSEFSRTVHGVSSAAYLNEQDNRERLVSTYNLGSETAPVFIGSYEDLSALSAEVESINDNSFTDVNFKLNSHITLAEDYVTIPSKFAGKIDFGDYTVVKTQSQAVSALTGCLTNARYVEVKDGTPYLVTFKGVDADAKIYQNNLSATKTLQTEEQVSGLNTTGTYSGKAVTFSLSGNDLSTYTETLNLDWTGEQLQALKELGYQSVTFNFMVYHGGQAAGATVDNTITNFNYLGQKYFISDGQLKAPNVSLWNRWYNLTLSIDEVAGKMTDKTLTVIENISKAGATPTFYFGDVSLSTEDISNEWTVWKADSAATTLVNKDGTMENWKAGGYDAELKEGYIEFNGNGNPEENNLLYIKLNAYTIEELEWLKEKGYTTISTTFYVKAAEGNTSGTVTFESALFGTHYFGQNNTAEIKTPYNEKIVLTMTIDELITAINNQESDGYSYLGRIKDKAGQTLQQFRFTDFVLTK